MKLKKQFVKNLCRFFVFGFILLFIGCAVKHIKREAVVSSIKSEVLVYFSGHNNKFKKRALMVVKSPNKIRFEIKGFWNEPFFIFVYNNGDTKIYFVGENVYYKGSIFEKDFNPVELFLGKTNKMIFNKENINVDIEVNFSNYEVINGINFPLNIEGAFDSYRLQFRYINPLINIDIPDDIFEFTIPKSAKQISENEITDIIERWSK
jgi:outer membrane lipoprotein-sorting protein